MTERPEQEQTPAGLKLRAVDAQDLLILSSCLQDALILVADLAYQPAEQRFVALINRFRWEAEDERGRVQSALVIDHVTSAKRLGVDLTQSERFLSLLAMRFEEGQATIELAFSGGSAIRLEVSEILCHLQDLGEPWPTSWRPQHEQEP